ESGTKFTDLIRDYSEGPHSGAGGSLGWVAKGQLDDRLTAAIFAAPVNGFSDVVNIPDDGLYLFQVQAEKTAVPDENQLQTIKSSAFEHWYAPKKDAVKIARELVASSPAP